MQHINIPKYKRQNINETMSHWSKAEMKTTCPFSYENYRSIICSKKRCLSLTKLIVFKVSWDPHTHIS